LNRQDAKIARNAEEIISRRGAEAQGRGIHFVFSASPRLGVNFSAFWEISLKNQWANKLELNAVGK
jgi:hypothetical protein